MNPSSYTNDGIPIFTSYQIDVFGDPSYYGYDRFQVVEEINYVLDYKQEISVPRLKHREPHLYIRSERFASILNQLMGNRLNVAKKVQESDKWHDMLEEVEDVTENHYFQIRKILKKYKFITYYNRIPSIYRTAKKIKNFDKLNDRRYRLIMKNFLKMDKYFSNVKSACNRIYFPNLRFVALKLMMYEQVPMDIDIPYAITKSKEIQLNETFDQIWYFINTIVE